ncbi:hypothetical protein [Endozoicomonas sp. SCSIO W0465]|uniref:hypothetical protein n=1 Tax=Endozoicomonas sp. SCSIO W0465 TaxID=2918516 RepID=UPI0020752119|nr:hypothetical protein [Endozoicomonas sp. SCSIO W0465]USE38261.1 hypothetical protein MJO57_08900 [Endozoicomonas sp. SCSIO W0465]
MAISKKLVKRLINLESLQHQQRLSDISRQLKVLEKHNRLIETLDAAGSSTVAYPTQTGSHCTGIQVINRAMFHWQLLNSWQLCIQARAQQIDSIRAISQETTVKLHRLERLRQRYKQYQ